MKILLSSLLLLLSLEVFSKEGGNGGTVILCKQNAKQKAELSDYYEARTLNQINIDLGEKNLSVDEKVEIVFKRIDKLSPSRSKLYREWYKHFGKEQLLLDKQNFPTLSDTGGIIVPNGCKLEQIIIQKTPSFPSFKRYLTNADLWNLLDNTQKAGLILHEIIYREAIEYGIDSSVPVRYLNSLLSSNLVVGMNPFTFSLILKEQHLFFMDFYIKAGKTAFLLPMPKERVNSELLKISEDGTYYFSTRDFEPQTTLQTAIASRLAYGGLNFSIKVRESAFGEYSILRVNSKGLVKCLWSKDMTVYNNRFTFNATKQHEDGEVCVNADGELDPGKVYAQSFRADLYNVSGDKTIFDFNDGVFVLWPKKDSMKVVFPSDQTHDFGEAKIGKIDFTIEGGPEAADSFLSYMIEDLPNFSFRVYDLKTSANLMAQNLLIGGEPQELCKLIDTDLSSVGTIFPETFTCSNITWGQHWINGIKLDAFMMGNPIILDEEGYLRSFQIEKMYETKMQNTSLTIREKTMVKIYPDSALEMATINSNVSLKNCQGETHEFMSGETLTFNKQGLVCNH